MLRSIKEILGYAILAQDGETGRVKDIVIEGDDLAVRYVVVDTGGWLRHHEVLLVPAALGEPNWKKRAIPTELTRAQIEASPEMRVDLPVTRFEEATLHRHYAWIPYWAEAAEATGTDRILDLHGIGDLLGGQLSTAAGIFGHVDDLILEDDGWRIGFLVVNTTHWSRIRSILLPVEKIESVAWSEKLFAVGMSRDDVEQSPEYRPTALVNRRMEEVLYDYCGRPHVERTL